MLGSGNMSPQGLAQQDTPGSALLLDPWMPDYDASVLIDSGEPIETGEVDPSVESADWKAMPPIVTRSAAPLFFLDGTRRIEARVLAWKQDQIIHGLFGSLAVGAVKSEAGRATIHRFAVEHILLLGHGLRHSETLSIGNATLSYEGISSAASDPSELVTDLQTRMRRREAELGEDLVDRENGFVFMDGPLAYITSHRPLAGIIKKIHVPYLDSGRFRLVPSLATGERTPIFGIRDGKNDRYSWYLRLGEGRRIEHRLAGIVRVEVRASIGVDAAAELANLSAARLPQFASEAARDPRAPQNLVPVGALEEELRRLMGDALMIRRAIETKLSEGVHV